ncbi:MAG: universal stress protein [Halobacteriaceae archaeon]
MDILAPVDGSDCSYRALEFATELVQRYDGTLHVVHVTDQRGETAETVLERATEILDRAGVADDPEIVTDVRLDEPRYANRVGEHVLDLVEERGYGHVAMGHHGAGAVERVILGSAAETVVRAAETPATIIP